MTDPERKELELKLFEKLKAAEMVYRAAITESNKAREEFGQMMTHPDSAAALHNAARKERIAVEQYTAALKAFTEAVVHGRWPRFPPKAHEPGALAPTRREVEIPKLITAGFTSKEIAARLGISFKTVLCHRSQIMKKLHMHEVAALVRYSIRHHLMEP